MRSRLSWDEMFFQMIDIMAERSVCLKRQVGAAIVKNGRVISMGYNGPPIHYKHCEVCLRENAEEDVYMLGECPAVHAEVNAIFNAARNGISTEGAILYTKYFPCTECCKAIVNAGIAEVKYFYDYDSKLGKQIFLETFMKCTQYEPIVSCEVVGNEN